MKKITYFVVGLFILSSFAAISIGKEEANEPYKSFICDFQEPEIIEKTEFIEVEVEGTNNYMIQAGKPILPIKTEVIYLPFGVKITDVKCEVQNINIKKISNKITPAPTPYIKDTVLKNIETTLDEAVYTSAELYPNNWFSYDVGVGLDKNMEHKTIFTIHTFPVRYSPAYDEIHYAEKIDVKYSYNPPENNPFPSNTDYELVIIAPESFQNDLQPLVTHKEKHGVSTLFMQVEDIYSQYPGKDDKPEQIKYFIKDAIEEYNTKYVLIVGGLKSWIYANPRDDVNKGESGWHVPVRYSNLKEGEPGYPCDLYYADIYKEGGVFDDWDSNGNGIYAEWSGFKKDSLDLFPDVALGRLACRNNREVKIVVDKIKTYEDGTDSWFKKIITVSGDGFLDQEDLDIQWDTNGLPEGAYTIYAQSENPDGKKGPVDEIPITIDRSKETKLTFNHDDHLTTGLKYPFDPVAEIVSVSDGDILGNTDFKYVPKGGEAYLNSQLHWADVEFENGILYIRGKTYDPKPYGYTTDLSVWIENSAQEKVFEDQRLDSQTYFEGEWTVGEELLKNRAGGLYYMPNDFTKEMLWSSNGKWTDQSQVINAINKGAGFVFFSGHGSPGWWGNHFPGIPGNRHNGETEGLLVFDFSGPPFLPMDKLTNDYKNPIVVVGGCHNSMFNISLIPSIMDKNNAQMTHCYGRPTPECWSWYIISRSKRGAIASMGNTGYGYGILGEWCTVGGLDNYITTEFFKQYGTEGHDILGDAYSQTLTEYIYHFRTVGDPDSPWDSVHRKTVEQWVLLGDPSLKIGGYESSNDLSIKVSGSGDADGKPGSSINLQAVALEEPISYSWDLDNDGEYNDATGKSITEKWNEPGVYYVSVKAIYNSGEKIYQTIVDIENVAPNKPSKPSGITTIRTDVEYTYKSTASDQNSNEIYYLFDWGDGEFGYSGPHKSGETGIASHIWTEKGEYEIKVSAFNNDAKFSEWSEPLTVSISKTRQISSTTIFDVLYSFLEKHPNIMPIIRGLINLL